MNEFSKALVSLQRNPLISIEKDYFGDLIGEWDIEWKEKFGTKEEKLIKGEWIFSRVLNGMGIQDLFILPSREERKRGIEPDGEYGTTIRTYNAKTGNWEIYYCCYGESTRLEAIKEQDKIVLTEIEYGKMRWIFREIKEESFHWQHMKLINDEWVVWCDCRAVRK